MSTELLDRNEPADALREELEALTAKLDEVARSVALLDRRRDELEDLVVDLMPAANGALKLVMARMDELEQSGALATARGAAQALQTASTTVDPADLVLLGQQAGGGVRMLRELSAPEIQAIALHAVGALRDARKGRPPTLRKLVGAMREPRVRRGLGAAIAILRALGEGASPAAAAVRAPAAKPAAWLPTPEPASIPRPPAPQGVQDAPRPGPSRAATAAVATGPAGLPSNIEFDAEGFMVDPHAWTKDIARAIAKTAGIDELTPEHWKVIEFAREAAGEDGGAPGMRKISAQLGVSARDLYRLFPGGPGILAARIAGLGKPKSCV